MIILKYLFLYFVVSVYFMSWVIYKYHTVYDYTGQIMTEKHDFVCEVSLRY